MSTRRNLTAFVFVLSSLVGCSSGGSSAEVDALGQDALGTTTITFGADWSETSSGVLRAGDPIQISYDASRLPTCRGTQGGIDQWAISAFYRAAGGDIHTITLAGLSAQNPAVIVPEAKGDLEVWFEGNNVWGCNELDSAYGKNYHFKVAASHSEPDWVGNAASVINRETCDNGPCDANRVGLEQGFTYDTWSRQRAAVAGLYFDVWEDGVTDWDNPDLWKEVDAQIHFRFAGQQAFSTSYVDFDKRLGNNARYQTQLSALDPFHGMPSVVPQNACPAATLDVSPDGQYVTTDVDYYFTIDSFELRPAPGQTYHGHFEDYAGPYSACL
jgi:hypothetical protein